MLKQEVKKIAELARLKIEDRDLGYYAEELSGILSYVEQLEKVNVEKVASTSSISGLDSITREDATYGEQHKNQISSAETLLEIAPAKHNNFIKVKNIFNN